MANKTKRIQGSGASRNKLFKQAQWFMRNCDQKFEFNWHCHLGAVTQKHSSFLLEKLQNLRCEFISSPHN